MQEQLSLAGNTLGPPSDKLFETKVIKILVNVSFRVSVNQLLNNRTQVLL